MKVLTKNIQLPSQADCGCWVITEIRIKAYDPFFMVGRVDEEGQIIGNPQDFQQYATLFVAGFKSLAALNAGSPPMVEKKELPVVGIESEECYPGMCAVFVGKILATEEFSGANVEDTVDA